MLSVLEGAQQGHVELPAAISLGVSTLLVLCMDVAMLYAALMLRLLGMRRADPKSMRPHRSVMATVAVLEAGTYAYMAWRYETPVGVVARALILSRALAAPLLSVYLAMARPLPVTARDILAQVELASGLGLIRDAVTIANDSSATLSQKVALFGASAVMTPQIGSGWTGSSPPWKHSALLIQSFPCRLKPSWNFVRRWPRAAALSRSMETTATARAAQMARGRSRERSGSHRARQDLDERALRAT